MERKPTGTGLIGQTGNKPGGSLAASVDPREKYGYTMMGGDRITDSDINRISGNVAFAIRGVIIIWFTSALLGFAFGYFFGRTH